jgi:DNA-binding transcriptional ArsR family regulator
MKCTSYHNFFEVMGNRTRVSIVESLMRGEKSVSDLCADLKGEQSKVSHSLKRLVQCNFVHSRRQGKQVFYALNKETIVPILKSVDKHVAKHCATCGRLG